MDQVLIIEPGKLSRFVLSLGCIRAIIDEHPGAAISLLTSPNHLSIAEQIPGVGEIITDTGKAVTTPALVHRLASGGYTHVYDLQCSPLTRQYLRLMRWILPPCELHWYQLPVPGESDDYRHLLLRKTRRFGCGSVSISGFTFIPRPADLSFLRSTTAPGIELPETYALLIPGGPAATGSARWPAEHYAELAARLGQHGLHSVILGSNAERGITDTILRRNPGLCTDLCGRFSLSAVPAIASRARFCIGNISGLTQLAALSGACTTVLCGAEDAEPIARGRDTRILRSPGRIEGLSAEEVCKSLGLATA